ncbi:diguanylate cyclase [Altererythrobacter soli]|uniref:diguanylate cyclase n=1 Tax=Croceibacterium soli TaxID=1739690 RepID=A0A6I4UTK4_9SPHN|nr:GGDEF domain-containing protein [Croceibacterium soli]MXP41104.1 diguanylate cyclase [Croceibacterium soli]
MHWAPPMSNAVERAFGKMVRLRPATAWVVVLSCMAAAALADYLTGRDLWFGPVYLLVICIATWSLGWREGQVTGIACMVLTFGLNGVSLYPHGAANFGWNLGLRFVAISIVVVVIAGARRAYVREWWLARTDVLTKALNRQAFFELAPAIIDPHRWRLLVYADLDGMKTVNDVHGHAAGDACLRAFGAAVRSMIRRTDIFARVGGDEFLIYMSVKDESAAKAVARRLHETMNGVTVESGPLKCSVGGLIVPPGEASMDSLVRSADGLMYEAKLRGASLQLGTALDGEFARPGQPAARALPTQRIPWWTRRDDDRRADGGSDQALPWMLR